MEIKICLRLKDNNLNALKIFMHSLRLAGIHTDDIIFVHDNCSDIALSYDRLFNVPKVTCKSFADLTTYVNDSPIHSDYYLILGEHIEIGKNTMSLLHKTEACPYEIVFQDKVIGLLTRNILDIDRIGTQDAKNKNTSSSIVKEKLDLTAYSLPVTIHYLSDFDMSVYVE
jgi:hypothetical protein